MEPERNNVVKGPWTAKEDAMLQKIMDKYRPRNWGNIGMSIRGRLARSCRLRWCNQLSPEVVHRPFTPEEDMIIMHAHARLGNKWATIARFLYKRTDNAVKNHWYSKLSKNDIETTVTAKPESSSEKPVFIDLTTEESSKFEIGESSGHRKRKMQVVDVDDELVNIDVEMEHVLELLGAHEEDDIDEMHGQILTRRDLSRLVKKGVREYLMSRGFVKKVIKLF